MGWKVSHSGGIFLSCKRWMKSISLRWNLPPGWDVLSHVDNPLDCWIISHVFAQAFFITEAATGGVLFWPTSANGCFYHYDIHKVSGSLLAHFSESRNLILHQYAKKYNNSFPFLLKNFARYWSTKNNLISYKPEKLYPVIVWFT